jgi:hypothetical protein
MSTISMPQGSSHAFSAEELPETDQGQAKAGVFITPIPGITQYNIKGHLQSLPDTTKPYKAMG